MKPSPYPGCEYVPPLWARVLAAASGLRWNVMDGYDETSPVIVERDSFDRLTSAVSACAAESDGQRADSSPAPDPSPNFSNEHGPFDPDELVRWAESYGHPEEWCKRAQAAHARAERLYVRLGQAETLLRQAAEALSFIGDDDQPPHTNVEMAWRARQVVDEVWSRLADWRLR